MEIIHKITRITAALQISIAIERIVYSRTSLIMHRRTTNPGLNTILRRLSDINGPKEVYSPRGSFQFSSYTPPGKLLGMILLRPRSRRFVLISLSRHFHLSLMATALRYRSKNSSERSQNRIHGMASCVIAVALFCFTGKKIILALLCFPAMTRVITCECGG